MSGIPPSLSVIITSPQPPAEVPVAVSAVADQCRGSDAEIILAYGANGDVPEAIRRAHPGVTLIPLEPSATLPQLLGAALARATGRIVAITDATCGVDAGWVESIVRAHESPHPVIGGAVEPDGLRGPVDWAAYFCDYGQFMRPLPEGVVHEVPGNNISMKRWALDRGTEFVRGEFWKTYWGRRLETEGQSLYSVPSIVVYYRKSFGLRAYLVHRFHNGRCFAGMRLTELSGTRRALFVLLAPGLPLLFAGRILRVVARKRRYLGKFVGALPVILLAVVAWSVGEICGYLRGPGGSCRHVC